MLNKILFIPDCHHPYNDERAWKLMLKAARHFNPHTVVTMGDFCDFYAVSSHSKDPNRTSHLEEEIKAAAYALCELDSLKAKRKIFISGNHSQRLERYLCDKAPELFNVVKVEELFKLKEFGWEYVPYKEYTKIGRLHLTHDVGKAGKSAVFDAMNTFQGNVVIGHTHRLCYAVEGNAKGKAHVGASFGWLGDSRQADYMHRVKAARDWALGFGIGYEDTKTGIVYIVPVPIVNYTCVIEGKLFK